MSVETQMDRFHATENVVSIEQCRSILSNHSTYHEGLVWKMESAHSLRCTPAHVRIAWTIGIVRLACE